MVLLVALRFMIKRHLTVKLRGRPEAPNERRLRVTAPSNDC
jgi:hypothetical protein